jgi:hypothetical protein
LTTHAFRPFIAPKKGICESALHFFLLWWNAIMKRRAFLEVIGINGRII